MDEPFHLTIKQRFHDWNYRHPYFLFSLVRSIEPQVVVEVGCYRALTACWIGRALQENNAGKLICLDNWTLTEHVARYGDPKTHAEENLRACGVDGWVELRTGESSDPQIWPDSLQICYIDGWHSYSQCRSDFEMARERGATLIAFDDTENCVGPRLFVDGFKDKEWQKLDLHSDNGLTILSKKKPRRLITFSQELPLPCPGVDLRPLSLEQHKAHFAEASQITGIDYSTIINHIEHDVIL